MPDGALHARGIRARASPRELLESDAAWASTGAFVTLYVAGEMHKWFARPPLAAVARAACEVLPFLPSPSPFVIGASCAKSAPSAPSAHSAERIAYTRKRRLKSIGILHSEGIVSSSRSLNTGTDQAQPISTYIRMFDE